MQEHRQEHFYNIGVSYKKADANTRGKFSLSKENQVSLLKLSKERGYKGVFIISTCNRTEISGFAERPCQLIELLCEFSEGTIQEFSKVSNVYKNQEAIHQLFRIGTGLESQILGDYEIVGQLRQSYKVAKSLKTTNAYSERLINSVLQASKRVKNETRLSSGTTSVSYAAIQYLIKHLPDYNSKNILVFGLGKMGKYTCKNLAEYTQNKSVCLINRTEEKTTEFVKEHATIRKSVIENLSDEIEKADVLIVSTGADKPTITKELIAKNKDLLILDLSMPENVAKDVTDFNGVTLVNIDELSKITDETLAVRQQEVPYAEAIIETHKAEFNEWLNHRRFTPAIAALKKSLENITNDEINFQKKKIAGFDESQAEILTSRFIQKITTQFVKHLKDEETSVTQSLQVINKVFKS
ncbi:MULTISPECIES: glutamyl-tRNA reductase [unclassified Polaribacter]|jgi:glutamyl-tRNA reductase|uniref:glutamyl-tRNA reductase n=1 Tax=unclassified Polaribacter TaxID=196858 RepID=UPI001C4F2CE2|nr:MULTISPECIES: glutamyl-tRNA reductase [unclassified Polaribacter]QXP64908.1 glutamyl-tRNA reductase [Polaribacter sp. HaHaR_3_91]QXP67403.1 glutamyl-tRNA reductase [Polaribacter sp. AHE13PA]QXP69556.1 glutamyl-tRNA reductase [Polaribacter sp. R2A056_3_33]